MLVASSLPNFENAGTPRVISEVKKTSPVKPRDSIRPRISSELLVLCATENRWWPRKVQVRAGQLFVGNASGDTPVGNFRLPLRHLSLAAGPLPNSLALYKGQNVVLTLQTASEPAFDLWVKAIAIEIIRQTPLDAVRYLDILTLQQCWNPRRTQDCKKDWNFNCTSRNDSSHCKVCTTKETSSARQTSTSQVPNTTCQIQNPRPPAPQPPSVQIHPPQRSTPQPPELPPPIFQPRNEDYVTFFKPLNEGHSRTLILQHPSSTTPQPRSLRPSNTNHMPDIHRIFPNNSLSIWNAQQLNNGNKSSLIMNLNKENSFEVLLKKCQSAENYVPVREKLLLFETLCKLGRESLSNEDGSKNGFKMGKKAVSMHDLSNLPYSSPGVRQICKYFENKTDIADSKKFSSICRTNRRLINSDTQLHDAQKALNYSQFVKVT